ncbi:hypothetical protein, partial [Pedobacter glucosidilyticus]|uniref:hypothetical protein n=1 Tax=Pedobacter glucosidilyticus TaxID=1122941 RepID=UPI0026F1E7B2
MKSSRTPLRSFATRTYHGLTILSLVYHHHSHRFKPVAIESHNSPPEFVIANEMKLSLHARLSLH